MRRVRVLVRTFNRETRKYDDSYYEADFHQWGCDYEEFDSGPGNYSTAIVEKDDGKIEMPPAHHITFLDKGILK